MLKAQEKTASDAAIVMKVGGGINFGLADLGKRFPVFATMPAEVYFKSANRLTFGLAYSPLLGNRVKIDSLYGGIIGPSQILFDKNGFPGLVRYYMRGFAIQGTLGKIIPVKQSLHAGIELRFGAGMMQHYIKARYDSESIPQIDAENRVGYDRLSNGLMFSQTINYHYLNTETVSFFVGLTLGQGFTKNRRSWDFSTMRQDNVLRKDVFLGLGGGLLIPITIKTNTTPDYYN